MGLVWSRQGLRGGVRGKWEGGMEGQFWGWAACIQYYVWNCLIYINFTILIISNKTKILEFANILLNIK